jgi:TrmH family RNA methyltransferase
MYISNPKNQRIKDVLKLDKASYRKEVGLFVSEGLREVNLAYKAGYEIEQIFICEEMVIETELYNLGFLSAAAENIVTHVSQEVYEGLAYRGSTEGIVAVIKQKKHNLAEIILPSNPLILVIEGVEKPGNLGAMLRTTDAVGIDAVLLCDMATDLYNPNVIRSGIGTVFTNQIAVDSTRNIISFLKDRCVTSYAASLQAKKVYSDFDFKKPTAFVLGEEANGLSELWQNSADEPLIIPMNGAIDSLNVSVAAAVLLYEALRQRK